MLQFYAVHNSQSAVCAKANTRARFASTLFSIRYPLSWNSAIPVRRPGTSYLVAGVRYASTVRGYQRLRSATFIGHSFLGSIIRTSHTV